MEYNTKLSEWAIFDVVSLSLYIVREHHKNDCYACLCLSVFVSLSRCQCFHLFPSCLPPPPPPPSSYLLSCTQVGVVGLFYFLFENMFSRNRLTPRRIKIWYGSSSIHIQYGIHTNTHTFNHTHIHNTCTCTHAHTSSFADA